jgi:Dockerin type I domain
LQLGADGLWRPGPASPAINGGAGDYSGVTTTDVDGQARIGIYDVGADEVSAATIVRRPLTAADVGPSWAVVTPPPPPPPGGGGCNSSGCAIQAENYTAILDPDGDGNIFSKLTVAAALGEQVLKAPNGSTVSPPAHETIATYGMTLQTTGTYTAYYRVRGFSGSTDSIFAPDGFALDPDNTIATSQDSLFTWMKDSRTFPIAAGNVGVPLEFRLGMREQQAEIDALVLNLNSSLTNAQLDALFAVLYGDYNSDGIVGAADYTVWRNSFGSNVTAWTGADGNGDGKIDDLDYGVWREHFGATSGAAASAGRGAGGVVPEPPSIAMASIALLVTRGRRKHLKSSFRVSVTTRT